MAICSIKSVRNLRGKRVLLRVDFNVPIKNGRVADDMRLISSISTIQYLAKQGARVIVLSHLGRPEGKRIQAFSLAPVAKRLGELLEKKVLFVSDTVGAPAKRAVMGMQDGDIVMLENMRFLPQEQGNKGTLAKQLSTLGNVFVLDGFAVAHRNDASVSGIAAHLPAYAGLLLAAEINGLSRACQKPKHPFVVVIGGVKMETKVPVIRALLPKADAVLVGGGMVNTYLKGKGYGVGDSLVDDAYKKEALVYGAKKKVILPTDVIVGKKFGRSARHVYIQKKPHVICKKDEAILDIGPSTIRLFASHIKKAKTIVWNGAVGYFEEKIFATGTLSIARLVAGRSRGKAFGIVGGGETVQAMNMAHMADDIDLVSTGGGAMLAFLAGEKLPGVEALKRKR